AAFVRFEKRCDGLTRGAFENADEIRRAEHGRHSVGGELDTKLFRDGKIRLSCCADARSGFHSVGAQRSDWARKQQLFSSFAIPCACTATHVSCTNETFTFSRQLLEFSLVF